MFRPGDGRALRIFPMEPKVPHSLVQSLRGIPDFATLDEGTLLAIVGETMNLAWKAGSVIFKKGEVGEALYIILEGECSIHEGSSPSDGEVSHPGPGDSFGEMSLHSNATHSRTATAMTDCEILVVPKQALANLLALYPWLAAHFQGVLRSKSDEVKQTA